MANSVFKNLNADDVDHTVTEIESCCMNCYKNVSLVVQLKNKLIDKIMIFHEMFLFVFIGNHTYASYKNSIL